MAVTISTSLVVVQVLNLSYAAVKSHKLYQRMFPDYPKRRAIFPLLVL